MALAMPMLASLVSIVLLPAMFFAMLPGILGTVRLLMRYVDIVVPSLFHEIDRTATGIVFVAVLAPVLRMPRGHVHVNRLINDADRCGMNDDGSCVDDFGMGKTSDVNAAIKAWLGDADGNADIGGECS